jgi:hypothetical protein
MEQLLNEMTRRSAVFDIVFWEGEPKSSSENLFLTMLHLFPDTRHLTLKGGTDFVASSRSLARALLFGHLVKYSSEMELEIYAFCSLTDPAWHAYQQRTKVDFSDMVSRFSALLMGLVANVRYAQRWRSA